VVGCPQTWLQIAGIGRQLCSLLLEQASTLSLSCSVQNGLTLTSQAVAVSTVNLIGCRIAQETGPQEHLQGIIFD
jgi:hypothetical protein